MSDFVVRMDDLVDYAASLSRMANTSDTTGAELVAGIAVFAGAWGGDAPGDAFFAHYGDAATETLTYAMQMRVQLSALSRAMAWTAQNYVGTEATNSLLAGGAATA
jgi:hypothetical protein